VVAGTSIGALIAAAYARGMPIPEMVDRARALKRRDLFRLNRMGMLLERQHSPAIYLEEPLREIAKSIGTEKRFDQLKRTLLVNTVDITRGSQVVWGLPGLRDVSVADAVYASCALPGFYPPAVGEAVRRWGRARQSSGIDRGSGDGCGDRGGHGLERSRT
jgi:NTE family protein